MVAKTNIEWCDSTFNPWIGCTKVSPACDHCYAERDFDHRRHIVKWGAGQPRHRTSAANWKIPLQWEKQHKEFFAQHGHRRRVFCASLADVFDNEVPTEWRIDLLNLILQTPNLDWLLLTKRIGNAQQMLDEALIKATSGNFGWTSGGGHLRFNNIWLGITICNQQEADRDIPKLLSVPARTRFLSIEPLLGSINLPRVNFHCDLCGGTGMLGRFPKGKCHVCKGIGNIPAISTDPELGKPSTPMRFIDWVIAGGESGPQARPMHPAWVTSLRDQCQSAGVPFLFKQWGEYADLTKEPDGSAQLLASRQDKIFTSTGEMLGAGFRSGHHSGGMVEQNWKEKGGAWMGKVGKKSAGRLLDGVEHLQFPTLFTGTVFK